MIIIKIITMWLIDLDVLDWDLDLDSVKGDKIN
jgi:hypothetical protein